jgi:hypothetical protein
VRVRPPPQAPIKSGICRRQENKGCPQVGCLVNGLVNMLQPAPLSWPLFLPSAIRCTEPSPPGGLSPNPAECNVGPFPFACAREAPAGKRLAPPARTIKVSAVVRRSRKTNPPLTFAAKVIPAALQALLSLSRPRRSGVLSRTHAQVATSA